MHVAIACEHLEECGTEGMDVERGREAVVLAVAELLHWCIAVGARCYERHGHGLAVAVILLRQSKVNKHRLVASHHYVIGLHVQVQHVVSVHVS